MFLPESNYWSAKANFSQKVIAIRVNRNQSIIVRYF